MAKFTLSAARVNANLTQQELAEKLGVSRTLVNRWENGKSEMRPIHVYAFCYVTGLSLDELLLPGNFFCTVSPQNAD